MTAIAIAGPAAVANAETVRPPRGGITVLPGAGSRYASRTGTHLELGLVRPGAPVHGSVRVVNSSAHAITVYLYGADGVPAVNGGYGFTARTEPTRRVGAWITLATARLRVPAHASRRVAFTLTPGPAPASGGDEVGAVVAEPVVTKAAIGMRTTTRFAMGVYLRLPAPAGQRIATVPAADTATRWPWVLLAVLLFAAVAVATRRKARGVRSPLHPTPHPAALTREKDDQ